MWLRRFEIGSRFPVLVTIKQWGVVALDSINRELTITFGDEIVADLKDRFSLKTDGGQFALVIKSRVLSDRMLRRVIVVPKINMCPLCLRKPAANFWHNVNCPRLS